MDRRQQKTRAAIFDAFGRLLQKKHYGNITVQEIIDMANIGRTTFYAHFETKDALLSEMCNDIFSHIASEHLVPEPSHDFSDSYGSADAVITHILYHLLDEHQNIVSLLTCESRDIFMRYFKESLQNTFLSLWGEQIKASSLPDDYLINHITGSFVETVDWWIRNDMKEKPDSVGKLFASVIEPIFQI